MKINMKYQIDYTKLLSIYNIYKIYIIYVQESLKLYIILQFFVKII